MVLWPGYCSLIGCCHCWRLRTLPDKCIFLFFSLFICLLFLSPTGISGRQIFVLGFTYFKNELLLALRLVLFLPPSPHTHTIAMINHIAVYSVPRHDGKARKALYCYCSYREKITKISAYAMSFVSLHILKIPFKSTFKPTHDNTDYNNILPTAAKRAVNVKRCVGHMKKSTA